MEDLPDIPDHIDIARPDRWVHPKDKFELPAVRAHILETYDDLFTIDILSRVFAYRILTEYPFLLDSKEKFAF